LRWSDADDILAEFYIPADQRKALMAMFPTVEADWNAAVEKRHAAENDVPARLEAAANEMDRIARRLFNMPAPDIKALAYKSAVGARHEDDLYSFDDLGAVASALDCSVEGERRVNLQRDLLRLAGVDHPILHMPEFSPRAWVKTFEAAGGLVTGKGGALYIIPSTGEEDDVAHILEEPWKARAVYLYCNDRRSYGGCEIFDPFDRLRAGARVRQQSVDGYPNTIIVFMTGDPKFGAPEIVVERPADRNFAAAVAQ
jgi:hypothetical protein